MRYLKTYKCLINEGFSYHITNEERIQLESEWKVTIEDIEDVLLDLSDLSNSRGDCKIITPITQIKVRYVDNRRIVIKDITQLIILANIRVSSKEEYESIISTIKNRFSQMNIHVDDHTLGHSRTNVELGIYFVCLMLMLKSDSELLKRSDTTIE